MKTIQLTHGDSQMELNEEEAVSLHRALSEALNKAGIDAQHHNTLPPPNGIHSFVRESRQAPALTDC